MSDDFIPLNQSTPVHGRWQGQNDRRSNQNQYHNTSQNQYHNRSRNHSGPRRGFNNRWGNNSSRNTSYSDGNSSYGQDKYNIDAYLHPSMLQDPWEPLRRKLDDAK